MKTLQESFPLFAVTMLLCAGSAFAQSPVIFFTDLESGPNSGGEVVSGFDGAYVTLYGNNFGTSQGASTITLKGASCLRVVSWGAAHLWYQKIVVQLDDVCETGNFVVTTSSGSSNGISFTIRSGNIRFVSTTGNDSNDGTFDSPWLTPRRAKNTIAAGDIAYIMDGVTQTDQDPINSAGAVLSITTAGTAGNPKALVAYPGATATIGTTGTDRGGIRGSTNDADYWVIAGLTLRGDDVAVAMSRVTGTGVPAATNWRIVGNDLSCPFGEGQRGCLITSLAQDVKVFGNKVHDVGDANSNKQYHGIYFSSDTNFVEAGWNHVYNILACRGILFHSSPVGAGTGLNQHDLSVHDNLVHDVRCDGINFDTVDPSKGPVEAYNNVIYRVGKGPHPRDGSSNYACVYVPGTTNVGPAGTGVVEVYNNTCYGFGLVDPNYSGSGAFARGNTATNPSLFMNLRNNVAYSTNGARYIASGTLVTGSNNLWFGAGSGPSALTSNVNADPNFVSTSTLDFHLLSSSPAINAGLTISSARLDLDGVFRPQGVTYDLGAYEFVPTPPPSFPEGGLVNNASYQPHPSPVSLGAIVAIFGANLTNGRTALFPNAQNGRIAISLAGTQVMFNGIPAPVFYATPRQIGVQVPIELAGESSATVQVIAGGQVSAQRTIFLDPFAPGIFTISQDGRGAGAITHADGSLVTPQKPAQPGEVVIVYATGLGQVTPMIASGMLPGSIAQQPVGGFLTTSTPRVSVDGLPGEIRFSGLASCCAGLNQINVRIPDQVRSGDSVSVVLTIGGRQSNEVTIAVRRTPETAALTGFSTLFGKLSSIPQDI